jgi:hypothetical protein
MLTHLFSFTEIGRLIGSTAVIKDKQVRARTNRYIATINVSFVPTGIYPFNPIHINKIHKVALQNYQSQRNVSILVCIHTRSLLLTFKTEVHNVVIFHLLPFNNSCCL